MTTDIEGNVIEPGCEVVFSRNLWRGKDVLCRGKVTSVSAKFCQIDVTSPEPEGIDLYEGWNISKRAKVTKVFVIGAPTFDDKYPIKTFTSTKDIELTSVHSGLKYTLKPGMKMVLESVNKKTVRCYPAKGTHGYGSFRVDMVDFENNIEFVK